MRQNAAILARPESPRAAPVVPAVPSPPHRPPAEPQVRRTGPPGWDDALFAQRWKDACELAGPPYTYRHIAPKFVWMDGKMRIDADPEYLGRLWRTWGKPGPVPY